MSTFLPESRLGHPSTPLVPATGSALPGTQTWLVSPEPTVDPEDIYTKVVNELSSVFVTVDPTTRSIGLQVPSGEVVLSPDRPTPSAQLIRAFLPSFQSEDLGDPAFRRQFGLRYAYLGGAMARGIASADLVIAMAQLGGLGFFGAAGLSPSEVETNLLRLRKELSSRSLPWGSNLIHSPSAPEVEQQMVDLYLKHEVSPVSASAFMTVTPTVVQLAATGLKADSSGRISRRHQIFAKISRPEVARHFMKAAPEAMLNDLVQQGRLTRNEAECAARIPLASCITVEADSGGHTDNRPLTCLFDRILEEKASVASSFPPAASIHVGAAGGLGTPAAVASAFELGAAFVLIGSVHQATVEAGISPVAKEMLAKVDFTDVAMTASGDMFEAGVKVQVLTRGSLMAHRGNRLYQLFQTCPSLEEIPAEAREDLERNVFRMSLEEVWEETRQRALRRNPAKVEAAEKDPRLKMAMVFRWYLGKSSRWPIEGDPERVTDYQIWCGPSMGAFNEWTKGSFLEEPQNRTATQVALNLLHGAARHTRIQQLRSLGVVLPPAWLLYRPRPFPTR